MLMQYMYQKQICWPHFICIHQIMLCLSGGYMGIYVLVCAKYEVTEMNYVTKNTGYILGKLHFMLLYTSPYKYGCHPANIIHIHFILYGQIDALVLHISAKQQNTATSASHVIAMYVPNRYMPTKLYIHVRYMMCICGDVCAYICYIWSHWHQSCD